MEIPKQVGREKGAQRDKNGRTHEQKHSDPCTLATFWTLSIYRKQINQSGKTRLGPNFPGKENDTYKTTEREEKKKRKSANGKERIRVIMKRGERRESTGRTLIFLSKSNPVIPGIQ